MKKVFVHNFDNLTNVINNNHEYIETQNINEADIIVVIVDKNDIKKRTNTIKTIITNVNKRTAIGVLIEHTVPQTATVSLSEIMDKYCHEHLELMANKFVIPPTVERPNVEILQKQPNKQQFITPNQRQYKQIRQIPKRFCFQNRTRCK